MADDHSEAMPIDARLRELVSGAVEDFWLPEPATDHQREAIADLGRAIGNFQRAFGYEATVNQFAMNLTVARLQLKRHQIKARILAARADINAEADEFARDGAAEMADAVRARPTPDYPERATDDAWLRRYCGYGV